MCVKNVTNGVRQHEFSTHITSRVGTSFPKIDTIEKWLADNKLSDTTILPMLDLEIDTEKELEERRAYLEEARSQDANE